MTTRFEPFAYLTAPNASLYRQVMLAFVAAKRRFVVHLRSEDVVHDTGGDPDAVAGALSQLVQWGNLRADPDPSRVTTVEDFHRARYLYQLTPAGEAAERSLAVFDEQLGRRGALQAVALEDIATGLRALHELTQATDPDAGRAALLLRDIVQRCGDLAENAQAFMGFLQRTIDLYELDADAFTAYKNQLIEYLERFVKSLTATGGEIAELLQRLDPAGVERQHGYFADHVAAAEHADELVKDIPLPIHHPGVASIDWRAQGPMSDGETRALLQFRATCDWLRERIANGPSEAADHVLSMLPDWPTHRGGATEKALRDVADRARQGDLRPARQFVALNCRGLSSAR